MAFFISWVAKYDKANAFTRWPNHDEGNFERQIDRGMRYRQQNAEMTIGEEPKQVGWYDDGRMELWGTAMAWGNWALCASYVEFNR